MYPNHNTESAVSVQSSADCFPIGKEVKRVFKRILILLILPAILTAAVLPASAAAGLTLSIGDVTADLAAGDEIRVSVTATQNAGYVSATAVLRWDNTALELCAVEFSDLAPDQGTPTAQNSGAFTLRFGRSARRENFTDTGLFFTAVFRIAENAAPGDYAVDLADIVALDTDLNYVSADVVPGTVTLIGEPSPTDATAVPEPDVPPSAVPSAVPAGSEESSEIPTDPAPEAVTVVPTAAPSESAGHTEAQGRESVTAAPAAANAEANETAAPWIAVAAAAVLCAVAAGIILRRKRKKK